MSQMEKTKHCANLKKQMDKVKSKINQKGWCSGETKCKEGVNVTVMCVNKTHGGDDCSVLRCWFMILHTWNWYNNNIQMTKLEAISVKKQSRGTVFLI